MTNLSPEICLKLRDARRAAKLSQSELAAEVGCKQSALSMFEQGDGTKLNDAVIGKLAKKFGVSLEVKAPVSKLSGTDASSDTPNFFASFPMTASFSFVPSPCSNIDNADCLQPTSTASSLWDSFAARRASLSFKQISGLKFVTGAYYGLYFIN